MNDNFLSKITPQEFIVINDRYFCVFSFMSGSSFCIFLNWQKCTHLILLLDILNPFANVLFYWCIIAVDALQFLYFDQEVIQKSST